MEHVACAQRIHGMDREGRRLLQVAVLVEPDRALRRRACPPGTSASASRSFSAPAPSSATSAVSCSGSLENTRCDDAVSSPSRSDIARSTSTTTGMPRRRASAHRSVQNPAQRLSVRMASQSSSSVSVLGRCTFHNSGSRKVTMVRSPLGSIMMVGDRRHQARHVHEVLGLDAFVRELFEDDSGSVVSRASPIGPQIEARPPRRTMPIAALSALPPQISSKWVAFSLEPRAGTPLDAKRQVAHRHADAEDARRDLWRGGVESSSRDPSCRFRMLPEPRSGTNRLSHWPGSPLCARVRLPHAPSGRADDGRWQRDAVPPGRRDVAA